MQKKQLLVLVGIGLVVLAGFLLFSGGGQQDEALLGDDVKIFAYTLDGTPTGGAVVSVPFLGDSEGDWFINVAVDFNGDGSYGPNPLADASSPNEDEWVVRNQHARVLQGYRNNFAFAYAEPPTFPRALAVRVVLAASPIADVSDPGLEASEQEVTVEAYEMGELLGINVPGASEELKRGPVAVFSVVRALPVFAQGATGSSSNTSRSGSTPDLRQGSMECTPTATANNLTSLANQNGAGDRLPQNPRDIIDELKNDMKFKDGVLIGNIKAGKDAFAERHNLPISTERIDAPSFSDIQNAIDNNCAVELSMSWVQSASGHSNTGHVVSVVGTATSNGTQQVQTHDPATPTGMDTLDLSFQAQTPSGDTLEGVDYPGWDGIAFIDAIFVQCWTGTAVATGVTRTDTTTGTSVQLSRVEMLVLGGQYYPKSQFRVADNPDDACGAPHYHTDSGTAYGLSSKTSTTIVQRADAEGCGYGKVSEVPREFVEITFEQSTELIRHLPL